MPDDHLAQLAAQARQWKPHLFTIYGLLRNFSDPALLGWGMQFPHLDQTLYYEAETSETHRADTPTRLLTFYQGFADARLEWLDHN